MFSNESSPFEIEENYAEFQELCSQLKNHSFPSPWSIFFKNSNTDDFISEVSEFVISDTDLLNDNGVNVTLDSNTSSTVFEKNLPSDTPFYKVR